MTDWSDQFVGVTVGSLNKKIENKMNNKCKKCGRNFTGQLRNGKCKVCAEMDYRYNQGALTLNNYKQWEKDWIRKL